MPNNDEDIVVIEKCPKCDGSHRYKIRVGVSMASLGSVIIRDPNPRERPFKGRFTCPVIGDEFTTDFLYKAVLGRHTAIVIKGLAEE